ncbi:MAG: acyl-CoA dehydrogenase family protein [Planctomycetota bacterium]|jgi:alkylation response protein AidB-like acyl-CoA dehydrogenase|nr:acyl-CoA dehydrogenase [Planctomycetota bacterium]MDP6519656.1 acyl-CoA dehydrogenase family protein [Planctomycetota bacterium]MDP6837380.1 acyl-CoA dehydrogenase family protein [Planctomycetota bacterium]MDP6955507.1 acyl-CoA dehydrogenase family protein [Planctomycetota bacterium]
MQELPDIKHAFDLTEDQRMIQDMVREFAERELAPQAAEIDEEHRFPKETWDQIVELGLPGIPFEERYGGADMGTLAYVLAVEEIARVCGSTGLTYAAHVSLGTWPIHAFGCDALKDEYVPKLISGEYMGAYGLTEPNAGSDSGGTQTSAVRDGDSYVLNGRKCFITNANHAGAFIVTAVTDKEAGSKGISAFVVPRAAAGFSLEPGEHKLGMRGSDWASLVFEDARIPADHLLGTEEEGFKTFMKTLDGGRISIGALALGIAQGAYDCAKRYASERIAFGKPLSAQQAVAFKLADMATGIAAARHLVYHAARLKDAGRSYITEGAMAKLQASEVAMRVTYDAIQIYGGYGFSREYPVERMWRDAKLCTIGEGTSEVQRLVISRQILRETPL